MLTFGADGTVVDMTDRTLETRTRGWPRNELRLTKWPNGRNSITSWDRGTMQMFNHAKKKTISASLEQNTIYEISFSSTSHVFQGPQLILHDTATGSALFFPTESGLPCSFALVDGNGTEDATEVTFDTPDEKAWAVGEQSGCLAWALYGAVASRYKFEGDHREIDSDPGYLIPYEEGDVIRNIDDRALPGTQTDPRSLTFVPVYFVDFE